MLPILRVDTPVLTASAHSEEALSVELSALPVGEPLATGKAAMAGLQSAAACDVCEKVLETARDLLGGNLSQYATKLRSAAAQYDETDGGAAEALRRFAGPVKYYPV